METGAIWESWENYMEKHKASPASVSLHEFCFWKQMENKTQDANSKSIFSQLAEENLREAKEIMSIRQSV